MIAAWLDDAACAHDPQARLAWFFPPVGNHSTETAGNQRARALCRTCPVASECLDWAVVNHENRIWSDTNDVERRAIRRRRRVA